MSIYNASIPGRLATADTEPVSVAAREPGFREFDPRTRPLWVLAPASGGPIAGWLGLRSLYGRPAYGATVEVAVYVDPAAQRRGVARTLLADAIAAAPALGVRTLLGFVFAHNAPSIAPFEQAGFAAWGGLPRVAQIDGIRRDVAILGLKVGRGEATPTRTLFAAPEGAERRGPMPPCAGMGGATRCGGPRRRGLQGRPLPCRRPDGY